MALKVFISHARKDEELALAIRDRLVQDQHKVFVANADVLPGQDWAREISEALSRSQAMVVLLSPEAVESRNVLHEISFALGSPRYEGRVLPVVVRPTGNIPWFLQTIMHLDVSGSPWPVAADDVATALRRMGRKAS